MNRLYIHYLGKLSTISSFSGIAEKSFDVGCHFTENCTDPGPWNACRKWKLAKTRGFKNFSVKITSRFKLGKCEIFYQDLVSWGKIFSKKLMKTSKFYLDQNSPPNCVRDQIFKYLRSVLRLRSIAVVGELKSIIES